MKKIFFISILMLSSASVFSQLPQAATPIIVAEKLASRHLKVTNETKCPQYFLVAGLKNCNGCNQNQEDYLTDVFYMVSAMDEYENTGVLHIDGFNLFQNTEGQYIHAYISHVKIPHDTPPQCEMGKILGENYCLSASTQIHYNGMMHCEIECYPILATWKPDSECKGTAHLTFTEYNPNP